MDVEAVLDRIYYLTGMRTQAEVAAFVGLGPTAVNSWKNNENIPRKHLKTISAAHGLDVRDLFVKSERHPKPGADPAHPVLQDEVLRGRTPYPTAQDVLDPYPLAREQGASAAYHRAADPHVHVPGCDDIRLRQSMLERMGRADRMEWMRWPGDAPEVRRGDPGAGGHGRDHPKRGRPVRGPDRRGPAHGQIRARRARTSHGAYSAGHWSRTRPTRCWAGWCCWCGNCRSGRGGPYHCARGCPHLLRTPAIIDEARALPLASIYAARPESSSL